MEHYNYAHKVYESRISLSETIYSLLFDINEDIGYYLNFYEYYNKKYDIKNINNEIKIYVQMEDNEKLFRFCLTKKDILYLLESKKSNKCEIFFSYSKNCILFLFRNNLYQINYNNGQLITIYELDNHSQLEENYLVNQIYYYNKTLTKIEELFLFKLKIIKDKDNDSNEKNERDKLVFPYFWNYFEFKAIKPFNLPNFNKIIQLNFFESYRDELKDSLNMERLLVNNDGVIIFK